MGDTGKYVMAKHKAYTKGVDLPRVMLMKKSNWQISRREVNL